MSAENWKKYYEQQISALIISTNQQMAMILDMQAKLAAANSELQTAAVEEKLDEIDDVSKEVAVSVGKLEERMELHCDWFENHRESDMEDTMVLDGDDSDDDFDVDSYANNITDRYR